MGNSIAGRVAVITGAAHGIGREICLELARRGATVWACDILGPELQETAAVVDAVVSGAHCKTRRVDVTRPGDVNSFINEVQQAEGRIDILVNNAGGVVGQTLQPLEGVSDDDWRVIFAINLDGAFHFTRAVTPMLKQQGRGSIVNISSGAGRSFSLTGIQAYASSKAGLIGFTRQTARELGEFGIRVNCVAPGFVRSNPDTERQWDAMGEEAQKRLIEGIALRRLGKPEDIAKAVAFFASDDALWITGQTISVDGGQWMLG